MKSVLKFFLVACLCQASVWLGTVQAACVHDGYCDRPIKMGVSIGNTPSLPYIYTGTAGMRVFPFSWPTVDLILSNNHVLGAVGPDLCPNTADGFPPPMTWTIQPGSLDLGFDPGMDPTFLAGAVFYYIPIDFSFGAQNVVDAAVAFTTPNLASTEILGIGYPNPAVGQPTLGMSVIKSGRTTGVTTSTVISMNTTVNVSYGDCGTATFVGQVMTGGGLGTSGDSGSVVLQLGSNTPVGLYFAGSDTTGTMTPILEVYRRLRVFVDSDMRATISSEADLLQQAAALPVDNRIELLKPIQARHEAAILAQEGVVGIGIGLDEAGAESAFVVYVETDSSRMRRAIPQDLEGVPVRLVESGPIVAH